MTVETEEIKAFLSSDAPRTIEDKIGYTFVNPDLLMQAFTHSSYIAECTYSGDDNEVLEFIGDKVLDMIVLKTIVTRYGRMCEGDFLAQINRSMAERGKPRLCGTFSSEHSEGWMTELKIALVKSDTLAAETERMGLEAFLLTGKSDTDDSLRHQTSVKENLFEAVLGAVTLDCRWNFDVLTPVVEKMLGLTEKLDNGFGAENWVGKLQTLCRRRLGHLPRYEYSGSEERYTCTVYLRELPEEERLFMSLYFTDTFTGCGKTKKESAANAAEQAYRYLEQYVNSTDRYCEAVGKPEVDKAVNQLQELWQKKLIGQPIYDFNTDETDEETGNPLWTCVCRIPGFHLEEITTAETKTEAKKGSAYSALLRLIQLDAKSGENEIQQKGE